MIYIIANPEERTIALQIVLRLEEAGIESYIHQQENKKANHNPMSAAKAVILIVSPYSLTTYEAFRGEIERAKAGKKTIFPLLYGMNRAEFDTKQTPWKQVIGTSATIQIKDDSASDVIPTIVQALRGIGIKPNTTLDTEKIASLRKQLMNSSIGTAATPPAAVQQPAGRSRSFIPFTVGIVVVALVIVGAYLFLNSNAVPEEKIVLRIHGSNTIGAKLMPALVEGFIGRLGGTMVAWKDGKNHRERSAVFTHPDSAGSMVIEVYAHGSTFAFKDLGNGVCDIGMSSREIKNEEAILLQTRGLGNMFGPSNEHVLAMDGLAMIVHPSNPVRSLSVEEVGKIFAGEIVNWKSISGENSTISLYARDTNSGTHETFQQLVLKKIKEDHISGDATFFEDSDELSRAVEADPSGIGFLGFAYAKETKVIAISESNTEPLFANFLTIGREDYPLARRLFLYTSATPRNPLVREFIRYALSVEGQLKVHEHKFVDLNIRVENNPVIPASAPSDYLDFVKNAKRISVNFRFLKGNDALDTKAQADLERVVEYLKENGYPQLKLAGFSDGEGNRESNINVSNERAEAIAGEFRSRGINILPANIAGFGSDVVITASKTPEGRMKNRRVEAWIQ